jgi:molecular chaperone HscA
MRKAKSSCLLAVRYLDNDGRQIGSDALRAQAEDPQNTLVSVKRFMGRGLKDIANADKLPYQFVDKPGMLAIQTRAGEKSPVEVSAENIGHFAFSCRRHVQRRSVWRSHHRARVL